jgi:hypothetical protein
VGPTGGEFCLLSAAPTALSDQYPNADQFRNGARLAGAFLPRIGYRNPSAYLRPSVFRNPTVGSYPNVYRPFSSFNIYLIRP